MRLSVSKSKNAASLYVIESTYINGVHSSKIVEKLGTYDEIKEKLGGQDPYQWAKEYIAELNKQEKENKRKIMVPYSPNKLIPKGEQRSFNGGYLFLQRIYHQLKLNDICNKISEKHKFSFDLNDILSRLLYARILFPASKLATHKLSKHFLEQPSFEVQHIYRALEVIAKESDFIQSEVYNNSRSIQKRNTGVLFYDCTNYFFEIEQESGLKQYGYSKEHRPNPIVQMGLFMDSDGIPLAFDIHAGNTNEQVTLRPLEQKILKDFELSRIVVCTDAGLASNDNRKFNDKEDRAFITTQSVKKLKKHLRERALSPDGWCLPGKKKSYDIGNLEDDASAIISVNQKRWEIEECFRIMKSEFNARPVYLSRDDRIKAHFTTCFLALLIYRFLEKKLEDKFTCSEIIQGLVDMNFFELKGEGYTPSYTRTDFTDSLHDAFGFRTDYEIITSFQMKKIIKLTKKP